MKSFRISKEFL